MRSDTSSFHEPRVGFGLRRPEGWRFTRPQWSPVDDPRPLSHVNWDVHGRTPFLVLQREGVEAGRPRPTLRVSCRPSARHAPAEVRRLLELQAAAARAELDDAEVLASSHDAIVGGQRAAHVRIRYCVSVRERRRTALWHVMAQSWLLFTPGLAFTIGATSCAEERRFDHEAFVEAVASVRVHELREPLAAQGRLAR